MWGRRVGTLTQLGDTQTVAVGCRIAGWMMRIIELLTRVRGVAMHSVEPAIELSDLFVT